ncbi:MAG: hypothetical protein LBR79_01160 [Oscillospiraceae bacterium]|jgi:hypothetical protein|nr:hypothetical protein [Oscillospiraceae bacterium]
MIRKATVAKHLDDLSKQNNVYKKAISNETITAFNEQNKELTKAKNELAADVSTVRKAIEYIQESLNDSKACAENSIRLMGKIDTSIANNKKYLSGFKIFLNDKEYAPLKESMEAIENGLKWLDKSSEILYKASTCIVNQVGIAKKIKSLLPAKQKEFESQSELKKMDSQLDVLVQQSAQLALKVL